MHMCVVYVRVCARVHVHVFIHMSWMCVHVHMHVQMGVALVPNWGLKLRACP
jgi:hypothetical protein